MGERDFIALIDGTHQPVKAPIVLMWDRLNTHVSHAMRELIAEREWLTEFLLPAYSPHLDSVEGVWAHVKRSLANLAVAALDRLEAAPDRASMTGRCRRTARSQSCGTGNVQWRAWAGRRTPRPVSRSQMNPRGPLHIVSQ
ncbi:transposase [Streptomyces sp. NBC_01795]|nr:MULTISPECIES: transposase [unclassified Streptomyces]WSA96010.1 transposase [Streptomyces sp. NBC_01795]WSS11369.1 transposase [Streptomyces sp. NBC_01186]